MPALLLLPPTSLAVEHPDMLAALKSNADSLTSQLDLYVTLREVMAMGSKAPLVEPTRGKTLSLLLSFPGQYADVAKKRGTVEHFIFFEIFKALHCNFSVRFSWEISSPPC